MTYFSVMEDSFINIVGQKKAAVKGTEQWAVAGS